MTSLALLPGLSSTEFATPRLRIHAITRGVPGATTVVFLHGNASAARFWEETLLALPDDVYAIAPDLRGFGRTQSAPIDATRGMRDFADDLHAMLDGVPGALHLVGWSAGAGVAMQYAIDHPGRVASLTLLAAMSPFGFGGTRDATGAPCSPDFAGSGGGTAAAEFVRLIGERDTGDGSPHSPRNVMNTYYLKPPFRVAREDVFVEEILSTRTEPGAYPGDLTTSTSWPGIAPGTRGMNNAISPAYCNLAAFAQLAPRPPVVWIRGAGDQIVSDTSLFDLGFLGKLGAVPGWPGEEAYPPQPMVGQVRHVLDQYRAAGGSVREVVLDGVGHAPHLEAPDAVNAAIRDQLRS